MAKKRKEASRDPIVGTWAGLPQYRCPFCPVDSLDEAVLLEHIRSNHPIPAEPEQVAAATPVEDPANATNHADQNDQSGTVPSGGGRGHDDGGGHDQ